MKTPFKMLHLPAYKLYPHSAAKVNVFLSINLPQPSFVFQKFILKHAVPLSVLAEVPFNLIPISPDGVASLAMTG